MIHPLTPCAVCHKLTKIDRFTIRTPVSGQPICARCLPAIYTIVTNRAARRQAQSDPPFVSRGVLA